MQWIGKTFGESTWKYLTAIQNQFPDFNLEDKVVYEEGTVRQEQAQEVDTRM